MASTVTIRDVARHAGVGVGTVSRVLNESEAVRDSTRIKVLSAIEELNYSPSAAARSLSSGKTMAVGVVVPFFTNDSVVRRVQGIVSVLSGSKYDLVLFDVENSENRDVLLTNIVQRNLVDGLLILSLMPDDKDMARFLESGLPAVSVDTYQPQLPSVTVDNVQGAQRAAQHLLDIGHRKIGYISDYPDNPFNRSPVIDRFAGYCKALRDAGEEYRSDYYLECDIEREEARRKAMDLLSLADRPTAIFAYCDMQAIGVLEAARDLGIRVPEELSIVGYDGIDSAKFVQLTTVDQSLFDSGVIGTDLLLQLMNGHEPLSNEVVLPTELVVRGSTAPPGEG